MMRLFPIAAVSVVLLVTACHSMPPQPVDPAIRTMMLAYDADRDGVVTRAEMETGLTTAFLAADSDRDGRLNEAEKNAVNDARWQNDASRTSPLQDWNQDGFIDAREFGTEIRSLFEAVDRDDDNRLSPEELSPPQSAPGRGAPGRGQGGPPPG